MGYEEVGCRESSNTEEAWTQKRQANYIAPLQPPTLASVKTWGSSEGAGRIAPAYGLN